MTENSKDEPVAFEAALKDLETIVGRLETGDLPIDQAIAEFEKGLGLLKTCRSRLENAELRVRDLLGEEAPPVQDG